MHGPRSLTKSQELHQSSVKRCTPYAPGLSTAHISPSLEKLPERITDYPYLARTINGNLSQISFSTSHKSRRCGGGLRGEVREFSAASRRRMQKLLNSIDQHRARIPVMITLTYHNDWSEDPRSWKDQLDAFRKRLERKLGKFSAIWRLEYQRRGAPHFHLLCWFNNSPDPMSRNNKLLLEVVRFYVPSMWWDVTGRTSPEHLNAGTRCELPRSWKGANAYLSKYMAKPEQLAAAQTAPGRFWGVWRKDELPISWEVVRLTERQAIHYRRILRKYSGQRGRGNLDRFEAFCSYRTIGRLLAAYGYYRN